MSYAYSLQFSQTSLSVQSQCCQVILHFKLNFLQWTFRVKPSQSANWRRPPPPLRLLTILAFDLIAGLSNRILKSKSGICKVENVDWSCQIPAPKLPCTNDGRNKFVWFSVWDLSPHWLSHNLEVSGFYQALRCSRRAWRWGGGWGGW